MNALLNSDFLSQPTKVLPNPQATRWLKQINQARLFISVVTLQEMEFGLRLLPEGQKQNRLRARFTSNVLTGYQDRILPVTQHIAVLAGELLAQARQAGYTAGYADAQIAATALHHGMAVATLNRKDFARFGVSVVVLTDAE